MYSQDLYKDLSFVLYNNNEPLSIIFYPIEETEDSRSVSIANEHCVAPLSLSEKIEKYAFGFMNEIAQEESIEKEMFCSDVLIQEYSNNTFNYLKKYGFMDCSISDTLIDLRQDENMMWSNLRKGHKSDIKTVKSRADTKIKIIDCDNQDQNLHELYRLSHIKCAGRETRSKATFDAQYKMLLEGNACLFVLYYKDAPISFNYFMYSQKTVEYGSASQDPKVTGIPVYHALLWEAIKYFSNKGYEYLRLTEPAGFSPIGGYFDYSSNKQINIARYKRGFGGMNRTLFRGTRYYNYGAFEEDLKKFKEHATGVFKN